MIDFITTTTGMSQEVAMLAVAVGGMLGALVTGLKLQLALLG